jgi:uncharacterized protein with HEPN domain
MPRDLSHVIDMLERAYQVQAHMQGVGREAFTTDELRQLAVSKLIQDIGEGARRLSEAFRESHPGIPWRRMIGMRNVLVHEYDQIDVDELWDAATISIPRLIAQLEPLVPPEAEE